jgi:ssDNA-binding replication factor A large subunit
MENIDLIVKILKLEEPKEIETNYGVTHNLIEGKIEDESQKMKLTVWNELILQLEQVDIEIGDIVELRNCFITSFKGVLSVNVGRDSEIKRVHAKEAIDLSK